MAESEGQGATAFIDDTMAAMVASMYEWFNARDIEALARAPT